MTAAACSLSTTLPLLAASLLSFTEAKSSSPEKLLFVVPVSDTGLPKTDGLFSQDFLQKASTFCSQAKSKILILPFPYFARFPTRHQETGLVQTKVFRLVGSFRQGLLGSFR
jgi:hypothetical protein